MPASSQYRRITMTWTISFTACKDRASTINVARFSRTREPPKHVRLFCRSHYSPLVHTMALRFEYSTRRDNQLIGSFTTNSARRSTHDAPAAGEISTTVAIERALLRSAGKEPSQSTIARSRSYLQAPALFLGISFGRSTCDAAAELRSSNTVGHSSRAGLEHVAER